MTDRPKPEVEALLAEAGWLRAIAAALVGDREGGEDLAQDTLVAALEQQPERRSSLRPWLKTVAHRLWADRQRSESRRRAADVEPTPEAPSAAETVERFALHRQVAEAVGGLSEPYRTAVLLRFYEGLPPREVAARTGVGTETARKRVQRGIEQLRASLDRTAGNRAAWAVPLVERVLHARPVTTASVGTLAGLTGGVLLMIKTIGIVVALATTATIVFFAFPGDEDAPPPEPGTGNVAANPNGAGVAPASESVSRTEAAAMPSNEPEAARDGAPGRRPFWTLEFAAPDGAALDGLTASLLLRDDDAVRAPGDTTKRLDHTPPIDANGRARWRVEHEYEGFVTVEAWAPGFVPLRKDLIMQPDQTETVRLAFGASASGRVVDPRGVGVAFAEVALRKREPNGGTSPLTTARTDANGDFRIGTVASGECVLAARKLQIGTATRTLQLAPRDVQDVGTLVLLGSGEIAGRVMLGTGQPAAGLPLQVRWRGDGGADPAPDLTANPGVFDGRTTTDDHGRFHFRGLAVGRFKLSHRLGRHVPAFEGVSQVTAGSTGLDLTLDAVVLHIRAEDENGAALEPYAIAVHDAAANDRLLRRSSGGSQAEWTFLLQPDRRYSFVGETVESRELVGAIELHRVQNRQEVVLRPRDLSARAALTVDLQGPDGAVRQFMVKLRSDTDPSRNQRLHAPRELQDGAFRDLQPGRYMVEVVPGSWMLWTTDLCRSTTIVEVDLLAGQTSKVTAHAVQGGRIALDFGPTPALRDGQGATVQARPSWQANAEFERIGVFRRDGENIMSAVAAKLGQTWTTEAPMLPGTWELRIESEGYRTFERAIVVTAGKTAKLPVAMSPE